jgi:class I fructose-bisphosphate aldolase
MFLGENCNYFLERESELILKSMLNLPGPDFVNRVVSGSDRPNGVLRNLEYVLNHGRLKETGYLSILPVDQGIGHSAGASLAVNPISFDLENIVELAIEGGYNAVTSTGGALCAVSRKCAHKTLLL